MADDAVHCRYVHELSFNLISDPVELKKCKTKKKNKCKGATGSAGSTGPTGAAGPTGTFSGSAWGVTGNGDTVSGTAGSSAAGVNFIGTTDAENLEVHLDNSTTTFFRFTQEGVLEFINPSFNTFLGLSAGLASTGTGNTAIGSNALPAGSVGNSNTAVGASTFSLNEDGNQNCAFGHSALLFNRSGNDNVAVGYFALRSNQNSNSTAVGANALQLNFEGEDNTAIGYQAMSSDQSGSRNTAVGFQALSVNVTGTNITCVGYGANVSVDALENASAFGNGAIATASNQIVIGNSNVTSIGGVVDWSVLSDKRYKIAVRENVSGLTFIKKLRPITYQLDMDRLATRTDTEKKYCFKTNNFKQSPIVKTGLIAQEVELAAVEVGYDFDGVIKPQNEKDHYRLSYSSLVVPLIRAVQEQQEMIETLQKEIELLKNHAMSGFSS